MQTVDHMLLLVRPFCEARGISESRLSTLLFNDGKRVALLRAGGDMSSRRLVTAMQWFSDNWPGNAEWPEGVDRPPPRDPDSSPSTPDGAACAPAAAE